MDHVEAGFDQAALDEAARKGFANGEFEDTEDDAGAVVEEFFPEAGPPQGTAKAGKDSLQQRLASKVQTMQGGTDK